MREMMSHWCLLGVSSLRYPYSSAFPWAMYVIEVYSAPLCGYEIAERGVWVACVRPCLMECRGAAIRR